MKDSDTEFEFIGIKLALIFLMVVLVIVIIGLACVTSKLEAMGYIQCSRDQFPVKVERWVDGDTAVVTISLGLDVYLKNQYLRLEGVDTPERGQEGYSEATRLAERTCPGDAIVTISGKGKYGRWISVIECNGVNLNEILKARGWTYK